MVNKYKRKSLILMTILLLIFFIVFIYSYIQSKKGVLIFNIGLSNNYENKLVMIFSFLSIIKVVYEIFKVEHKDRQKR